MTRARTRPVTTTYTVDFEQDTRPLTVSASCIGALVAAILDRARQHHGTTRLLYAVVEPDGRRGYLWSGRHIVDSYVIRTGGAR